MTRDLDVYYLQPGHCVREVFSNTLNLILNNIGLKNLFLCTVIFHEKMIILSQKFTIIEIIK